MKAPKIASTNPTRPKLHRFIARIPPSFVILRGVIQIETLYTAVSLGSGESAGPIGLRPTCRAKRSEPVTAPRRTGGDPAPRHGARGPRDWHGSEKVCDSPLTGWGLRLIVAASFAPSGDALVCSVRARFRSNFQAGRRVATNCRERHSGRGARASGAGQEPDIADARRAGFRHARAHHRGLYPFPARWANVLPGQSRREEFSRRRRRETGAR